VGDWTNNRARDMVISAVKMSVQLALDLCH